MGEAKADSWEKLAKEHAKARQALKAAQSSARRPFTLDELQRQALLGPTSMVPGVGEEV